MKAPPHLGSAMEHPGIYGREAPALERAVQVGYASGKVISVSFPTALPADAEHDHPLLDRIVAYLEGHREQFDDVEVALTVPTDHRTVLQALRGVPYGEEVAAAQLARMSPGLDEDDDQVIRGALADNPAPLVVPDHRVRDVPSAAPPTVERTLRQLEEL